jgi:transaldolase
MSDRNPLLRAQDYGQSIWLDFIRRGMLESGELKRLIDAYRDHGDPAPRLEEGVAEARKTLQILGEVGIDLDEVTQQLEDEGVEKFVASYDQLMDALERRTERTNV